MKAFPKSFVFIKCIELELFLISKSQCVWTGKEFIFFNVFMYVLYNEG